MTLIPALERELIQASQRARSRQPSWSGRLRERPRLLVALLLILTVAGSATAAVSLLRGQAAPVRIGAVSFCPVAYPYLADGRLKLFFPPNYPGRVPGGVHGISCYGSARAAGAAGYRLAPTPAGDVRLGPVYLAPASAAVRRVCADAQRLTRASIYCPSMLPAPWTPSGVSVDCVSAATCYSEAPLSISGEFAVPSTYVGSASGTGDVTIWEMSKAQQRTYPYLLGCPAPSGSGRATLLHGRPAAWYACAMFPGGGGSALQWTIDGETYAVSANGPRGLRRRLVRYIAGHMVVLR